jgi:hypothetical protein
MKESVNHPTAYSPTFCAVVMESGSLDFPGSRLRFQAGFSNSRWKQLQPKNANSVFTEANEENEEKALRANSLGG